MANAWKRDSKQSKLRGPMILLLFISLSLLFIFYFFASSNNPNSNPTPNPYLSVKTQFQSSSISPFNCKRCPQSYPVIANIVENLKYPLIYSLPDFGKLPEKPHKNIARFLKGKPFRKPDISETIQGILEGMKDKKNKDGLVVDVGANVGMASFAAAVMGFKVLSFEPVFENLQRLCDGIWFNRVEDLVTVFEAAVSDRIGNITFHKVQFSSHK